MATQAQVRRRAQDRRLANRRLGQEFARFEHGEGGLEMLASFVGNERLVLTDRLRAIEVGLKRQLITADQLAKPQLSPVPGDFGLPASTPSTGGLDPVPMLSEILSFLLGATALVMIFNLLNGWLSSDTRWLLAFASILSLVLIYRGKGWMRWAVDRLFPQHAARRLFREACLRHDVLRVCRVVRALEGDVRAFHAADGPEFERLVARAFRRQGYRVEEQGGANDGGVDLLVWKGSFHAIVQCKAHAKPASPAVVRELLGTLAHSRKARMAYLATIHGVSESAREWCQGKPITILEADHIIRGRF